MSHSTRLSEKLTGETIIMHDTVAICTMGRGNLFEEVLSTLLGLYCMKELCEPSEIKEIKFLIWEADDL